MASRNVSYYGLFFGGPWSGRGIPMSDTPPTFEVPLPTSDIVTIAVEAFMPKEPKFPVARYDVTGQVKVHDVGSWRIYAIYEPKRDRKKNKIGRRLYEALRRAVYERVCEDIVRRIETKGLHLSGEGFRFEVPGEG